VPHLLHLRSAKRLGNIQNLPLGVLAGETARKGEVARVNDMELALSDTD
jgi:hypothetical protein